MTSPPIPHLRLLFPADRWHPVATRMEIATRWRVDRWADRLPGGSQTLVMIAIALKGFGLKSGRTEVCPGIMISGGAGNRNRTGTVSLYPRDFKSLASACSATPAKMEATPGFEPGIKFAVLCLTTLAMSPRMERKTGFEPATSPGKAMLTTEPLPHRWPRPRIELGTRGFSVRCSTD